MSTLLPSILQPSQSQYQGNGKLLGRGGACCGLSWEGKGLPSSCHLQGAGEVSGWPVLSFPTQGELSVPCCLLSICNRCKYLLLIYSLKELQSSVCVCVCVSSVLEGLGVLPAALLLLSPSDTSSFRLLLCSGGALDVGQDSAAQDLLSKGK